MQFKTLKVMLLRVYGSKPQNLWKNIYDCIVHVKRAYFAHFQLAEDHK